MPSSHLMLTLIVLLIFGYFLGKKRSINISSITNGRRNLHSHPTYYGYLVVIYAGIPALIILLLGLGFREHIINTLLLDYLPMDSQLLSPDALSLELNEIKVFADSLHTHIDMDNIKRPAAIYYLQLMETSQQVHTTLVFIVAFVGMFWGWLSIKPKTKARNNVETFVQWSMILCASVAILTTIGIIFSVLFESLHFFKLVPANDFLFGTQWSPQTPLRTDQIGSSGSFGAIPLFIGTLLISTIALIIAVPLGLMTAIFLSEYANPYFRAWAKPGLEILAGIPTVVYGFFAALTVAPFIRDIGSSLGLNVASESALATGLVMGIMIIPFVSSISDDVISAVPSTLRDASLGLGATYSETIKQVIIPAALPGIIGGILLAASRAIGETMIVVMAAGLSAKLSINPIDAVTTVTVQMVTLLTGDQAFDSPKTLAAFALGLGLFMVTLMLNIIALKVIRRYREQYE